MTIRVIIVDDQSMVREGLVTLLSSAADIEVIGEAGDGAEGIALSQSLAPDVVVMDVRMPGMDGLAAAAQIIGSDPSNRPRVLMLTTFDLDEYVYEALSLGASGFLLKDASAAELMTAVRTVAQGDALLAPSVTRRLIDDFSRRRRHERHRPESVSLLTPRETEVLRLIARGLSNGEIAGELVLSEQTVKTHVGRILTKLELRDRTQAVVFAYQNGIVS